MTYKYEYAGFWLRFGAMIIDSLILCLAIIPAAWIFYRGDYDLVFATGLSSQPQNYWFDLIVNYAFPFYIQFYVGCILQVHLANV